jgi:hypothetical protein
MVWYFKRWLARDKAKKAQQELEMNSEVAVSEGEGVPRDEAKGREGEKI